MPAGHVRRKSNHFAAYDEVANDSPRLVGIDPWRINPEFSVCGSVNFHERQGEECLAANVDRCSTCIREKYKEYGIDETPFVVVKADAGTYGMGVMTVKDADEVIGSTASSATRWRGQGRPGGHEVIIQEGVHSFETLNDGVAEPVVYMIDRYVVGGFYRVHTGRGKDENLNAPGMHFEPLAFETGCNLPDYGCQNPTRRPTASTPTAWSARLACWPQRSNSNATAPRDD
jgi:glutamate--cysteine ligase